MASARKTKSEEELQRMSFGDHLDELRKRLFKALIAVLVCIFVLMPLKTQVTAVILGPYRALWEKTYLEFLDDLETRDAEGALTPPEPDLVAWNREYRDQLLEGSFKYPHLVLSAGGFNMPYTLMAIGGLEDFWIFMAASFIFALVIASPVVIYQAWAFIAAGLYKKERKVVHKYLPMSIGLMMTGVLFGYFVVVPYGLYFLVKLMNAGQVNMQLTVSQYFSLLFTLTGALGIVFQLPLVMLALNKIGIISYETFSKNWRYVIIVIFILSAMFTPPDPFTQVMMAIPMMCLYGFGLLMTSSSERKRRALAKDGP